MSKKRVLCIICARKGSKRLKNKNIKKLFGKPLIFHTIKQAINSKIFDKVVFSSDSKKLIKMAIKFGALSWFVRPKKLSNDKAAKMPVIKHAILEAEKKFGYKFDYICDLDVTSPLRKISTIKSFINHCLKNKLQCCLSVTEISENISFPSNSLFLPLSKNRVRSQDKKPFLLENGLIYFISKKFFMKNKKIFINNKCNIFITEKYESIDINNKKDYIIAKKLYK